MANLRLPGRSALTVAPPLSTTNICARTKRARQRPVARLLVPTFHVLCPAWAERADRRPNRCAVTGAPVPTSPPQVRTIPSAMQTWRRPHSVLKSSCRHRFSTPRFLPSRIFRWLHHIHPIHRHHTAPTHLQNPSHLSRPVEGCEGYPTLAGLQSRSGRSECKSSRFSLQFGDGSLPRRSSSSENTAFPWRHRSGRSQSSADS